MYWLDVLSLAATIAIFGALVYITILVTRSIHAGVESTRETLKNKGIDVTASGMSVKTSKRFDREDYMDATQRGVVKALQASSFRRNVSSPGATQHAESMDRTSSNSSTGSEEKKKKKSFLSKK